jgi:adenylate kinase
MIVFMGVAGSGKSLQGKMLADQLGLPWLSTGEFLRMLVSGERRKQMLSGKLLGDQEIISLVQRIFNVIDPKKEFIIDGFPRTVAQADWLLNQVKHGQLEVSAVVHLKASEDVIKKRLIKRGRLDDTKDSIAERVNEYKNAILPILEHFKEAGVIVHDIEGDQSVEAVNADIKKAINNC